MPENSLNINVMGHLTIGGMDTVELAQQWGTPLMVMDEEEIRRACRMYRAAMGKAYGGYGRVLYASKAFCCKAMCRIAAEEGMGLDVVSGGELYTARSAGFPVERICFHGSNKTPQELAYAVQEGVGCIAADNMAELEQLQAIASAANRTVQVLLRVRPGIDAHTHAAVKTGNIDSKFGFALQNGEVHTAVRALLRMDHLELIGLHCHIGSQVMEIEPYQQAAMVMLELMAGIRRRFGLSLRQLNLGGGFGVPSVPVLDACAAQIAAIAETVYTACAKFRLPCSQVMIEPGRSVVGPAGITLYRVGAVKEIPGVRTYLSIDGGMTDNPRYALYGAPYVMTLANRAADRKQRTYTVAGRCCESGDLLGEEIPLQIAQTGDFLAVLGTGAYHYSMASNYNRVPRPAVVMVRGGQAREIIRRESWDDLLRLDR